MSQLRSRKLSSPAQLRTRAKAPWVTCSHKPHDHSHKKPEITPAWIRIKHKLLGIDRRMRNSVSKGQERHDKTVSTVLPVLTDLGLPDGLHKPLGLALFPAYLLGAVSNVIGYEGPVWLPVAVGAVIGSTFACLNRYANVRVWTKPKQPLHVIVTGGSRGLGKALAREFLMQGDRVLITARSTESVQATLLELQEEVGPEAQVYGIACDVADTSSLSELEQLAQQVFSGRVDAWINNAGYSGSFQSFTEASLEQVEQVVRTNLLGTVLCSKQAVRMFKSQPTGGHLFNMDGAGASGFATPNYAAYGATKAGIAQFTRTLVQELKGTKACVHTLSPGMILTELLLEGATTENKQAFNILCEHPETVAAFLVPRLKSVIAHELHGTSVQFLTPASAIARLLTAPLRVGRFFDEKGNVLYPPEKERILGKHAKATARLAARVRRRNQALQVAYSLSMAVSVMVLCMDVYGGHHGLMG